MSCAMRNRMHILDGKSRRIMGTTITIGRAFINVQWFGTADSILVGRNQITSDSVDVIAAVRIV